MHNLKYFVVLSAAAQLVCLAGCNAPVADSNGATAQADQPAEASPARIGTINVARIYNLTGLQNQRNAKLRDLKQKSVDLDKKRNEAMQKKIKEFGDDPKKLTDDQKQELQQMQSEWVAARRDNTADAQQVMRETDQFLNNIYHQQTSEPIRKIAEARGLDVVLVMQRNLFAYVNPDIDITDDVIKQLNITAAPPETTPPLTDLLKQSDEPPAEEAGPLGPAQDKAKEKPQEQGKEEGGPQEDTEDKVSPTEENAAKASDDIPPQDETPAAQPGPDSEP
ncbi:MAG: OmpH family outer membrane protein [Planctomycetota bacterium]|nr:OmpH family outer membrane protein [Planctomycetota bacterium]